MRYDIVVAGGGLAGALFGGVMARAGYGVLIVEREAHFRDRVRGESTFPWGVAEINRLNVRAVFDSAGALEITGLRTFSDRIPSDIYVWSDDSIDGLPMLGFRHPALQDAVLAFAVEQGAELHRPAKVRSFAAGGTVDIQDASGRREVRARLVVGADGRSGASRRWTGGESGADSQNHRMGGALVSGLTWDAPLVEMSSTPRQVAYWFPVDATHSRVFLARKSESLRRDASGNSFDAFVEAVSAVASPGRFAGIQQAGPLAFFPNQCTWSTHLTGNGIVLVGDAAGSLDPTQGHGTSQLLRDVRVLSELLTTERDWQRAIDHYAKRHWQTYGVLRAYDRWMTLMRPTSGVAAERLREGHLRAIESDPSLGGWRLLSARGPDGLIADDSARRHFFGEDLIWKRLAIGNPIP